MADAEGQTEEGELLDLSAERKTVIIGPELARDLQVNLVACFRLGLDA